MTAAWSFSSSPQFPSSFPGTPRSPAISPLSRSPLFERSWTLSDVDRGAHRSWSLAAGPPPPSNVPLLPPEILRRIIAHALALPRSYPADVGRLPPAPSWDAHGGRAARKALAARVGQREGVARTARALLCVCRAWKPLVLKYLYAEPHIHGDNVAGLAQALVLGDRKWSDINIHPHSVPGRWITVLDLSHLGPGGSYLGADPVTVRRACAALLELAPRVTHLRLPVTGVSLDDLRVAPCIRKLKALEGVHLGNEESEGEAVRLLRAARELEVLGLVWIGSAPLEDELDELDLDTDPDAPPPPPPLNLAALHTLTLVGGAPGTLLATLTRSELPRLSRLVLSPYEPRLSAWDDDPVRGGRRALQVAHGGKIVSLTYVATMDWPRQDLMPPADTLSLHPQLRHLNLALPHALLAENSQLALALARPDHTLMHVTLPRWPRVPQTSVSPGPGSAPAQLQPNASAASLRMLPSPGGNAFLSTLMSRPSRIRTIAIDGFTWVPPALGRWAAESGDSGMMRNWAAWLVRFGVELKDMEGGAAPIVDRGRAVGAGRSSFDAGSFGGPMQRRGSGQGRGRSSFDGGALMAAAAIARRQSGGSAGTYGGRRRVNNGESDEEVSDGG
ncbi:hypothetical protein Q8F55_002274 [Vanrija albida]|uniref:F-box domain-containing protein n=1 Tax=Vanrija albida TaxID=181172 RepID=A0ABR3Q9B2_9TREE